MAELMVADIKKGSSVETVVALKKGNRVYNASKFFYEIRNPEIVNVKTSKEVEGISRDELLDDIFNLASGSGVIMASTSKDVMLKWFNINVM